MSKDFENKHPRDKQGKFVDKHISRAPDLALPDSGEEEYAPTWRFFNSRRQGGIAMYPTQRALSDDVNDRIEAAQDGQPVDLDQLVDDPSPIVRRTVAEHGKHLDTLVGDPDPRVRMAVAYTAASDFKTRHYLDTLIDDPDENVRAIVARCGQDEHRARLAQDTSGIVKAAVIRYGDDDYLDTFADDPDPHVQKAIGNRWLDIDEQIDERVWSRASHNWVPDPTIDEEFDPSLLKKIRKTP